MATPLIVASIIKKTGRAVFRQAGRFASKNAFIRQTRNTARRAKFAADKFSRGGQSVAAVAKQLMDQIGPPLGGGDWVSRVRGSGAKFAELAGDNNELG